ncbi:MAG: hypothetical protein GX465_14585 [Acidobacteria bacterium]|nr:hypothetical protein [Acidobacteriota bacterium]
MEFNWTFKAIKDFEKYGKRILKQQDIKVNGQPTTGMALSAGAILVNFIKLSEITEGAIAAMLGDLDLKPSEALGAADKAIQEMLDSGDSLEDIQNKLYRAFLETSDPSSIPIWEAALEKDRQKRAEILQKSSGEQSTT